MAVTLHMITGKDLCTCKKWTLSEAKADEILCIHILCKFHLALFMIKKLHINFLIVLIKKKHDFFEDIGNGRRLILTWERNHIDRHGDINPPDAGSMEVPKLS